MSLDKRLETHTIKRNNHKFQQNKSNTKLKNKNGRKSPNNFVFFYLIQANH